MIGQQNLLFRPQQRQRRHMKMVGMAVRDPDVFAGLNQSQFLVRQRPVEAPTAEITGPVSHGSVTSTGRSSSRNAIDALPRVSKPKSHVHRTPLRHITAPYVHRRAGGH